MRIPQCTTTRHRRVPEVTVPVRKAVLRIRLRPDPYGTIYFYGSGSSVFAASVPKIIFKKIEGVLYKN